MQQLIKPLIVFDLETTGVDTSKDRIVQMCIMKINKDGESRMSTTLVNPEMPIPQEASDVHGITDEMVKERPTFKTVAKGVLKYIEGCDILGFNSNRFDIVLLYNEFARSGLTWDYQGTNFIDACTIFKRKEERTLSAAVKFYLGQEHEGAHDATADVIATWEVFQKQLKLYEDLPKSLEELNLYCNFDKPRLDLGGKLSLNEKGNIIFNFGNKAKGKEIKEDISYANWMLNSDFPADVKEILKKEINEQRKS